MPSSFSAPLPDVELFVNTVSEHASSYKKRMQPSEDVCDPDQSERKLKKILNDVISDYSSTAAKTVSNVRSRLRNEFEKLGLECFNTDYQIQKRLRELFPTQRRLDDIEQLIRDATTHTLKTRIEHRFEELERDLKNQIHRHTVSDPLTTAARDFVQELLHYVSVTVGNRGEFLRHRFNLRLKTLIKAAQDGKLDTWSALSDDDDEEGASPIYLASSSSSGNNLNNNNRASVGVGVAFAAAAALNGHAKTTTTGEEDYRGLQNSSSINNNNNNNGSSSSFSSTSKPRFPAPNLSSTTSGGAKAVMNQYQRVSKIESSSTAVLDELTELRRRLDRMTSTRHEEIEQLKKFYEDEMASERATAAAKEHRLRTDAADLRVRVADMDRVLKQTGDLIQRLHAQSLRYRKDINLFVELSRDQSLKNCYPLMAKRLTQIERDDLEKDSNKEVIAKDDEVLQRIGIHLFSFEGHLPSIEALSKQHDILNAMRAALMNHEKTKEVIEINDALIRENDDLKRELIDVRNQAKRSAVQVRNEASAREGKLLKEVQQLKILLDAATRKLRTSHIAVIGTNDELTTDLIQKLEEAELRNTNLERELQIAMTVPSCSRAPSKEGEEREEVDKRQSLVLKRKRSLIVEDNENNSNVDDDNAVKQERGLDVVQDLDDDEDQDDEEQEKLEAKLFASKKNRRPLSSSSFINRQNKNMDHSHSNNKNPTQIPSRFIEPDVKQKILKTCIPRPPSATMTNSTISASSHNNSRPHSAASTARPGSATGASTTTIKPYVSGASSSTFGGGTAPSARLQLLTEQGKEVKDENIELVEGQLSRALDAAPRSARNNGLYWEKSSKGGEKLFDKQFRAAVTTLMRPSSATLVKKNNKIGMRR